VPQTDIVFFMDREGHSPALEWIQELPQNAQAKLGSSIKRVREMGHELRRPECDYLRDKIYELRARLRGMNHRLLYFFHQQRAVISHGLIKEGKVSAEEIDKAIVNKVLYKQNPERHTLEAQ
jgi:phage-related protein